eukprot:5519893-Amphidinium_carterae.1
MPLTAAAPWKRVVPSVASTEQAEQQNLTGWIEREWDSGVEADELEHGVESLDGGDWVDEEELQEEDTIEAAFNDLNKKHLNTQASAVEEWTAWLHEQLQQ